MQDDSKLTIAVVAIVAFLVLVLMLAIFFDADRDREAIIRAIEAGATPLEARCAIAPNLNCSKP